jgi:hypothetical protein
MQRSASVRRLPRRWFSAIWRAEADKADPAGVLAIPRVTEHQNEEIHILAAAIGLAAGLLNDLLAALCVALRLVTILGKAIVWRAKAKSGGLSAQFGDPVQRRVHAEPKERGALLCGLGSEHRPLLGELYAGVYRGLDPGLLGDRNVQRDSTRAVHVKSECVRCDICAAARATTRTTSSGSSWRLSE